MLRIVAGDGDNKPGSPGRARRKPLKPIAQGMPALSGEPVVTNSRVFLLHARLRVRQWRPAFPAPSVFEGHYVAQTRAGHAAGPRSPVFSDVMPGHAILPRPVEYSPLAKAAPAGQEIQRKSQLTG